MHNQQKLKTQTGIMTWVVKENCHSFKLVLFLKREYLLEQRSAKSTEENSNFGKTNLKFAPLIKL